jgi:hypothetical protein
VVHRSVPLGWVRAVAIAQLLDEIARDQGTKPELRQAARYWAIELNLAVRDTEARLLSWLLGDAPTTAVTQPPRGSS